MRVSKTAKRYACALYEAAAAAGVSPAVRADMASMGEAINGAPELAVFLADYAIAAGARGRVLEQLFKGRVGDLTWRFMRFIEFKKRAGLLDEIAAAYLVRCDAADGIVRAALSTAFPADQQGVGAISAWLGKKMGCRLEARHSVDAGLVGGFVALTGDTIWDCSVTGQLSALRTRMIEA